MRQFPIPTVTPPVAASSNNHEGMKATLCGWGGHSPLQQRPWPTGTEGSPPRCDTDASHMPTSTKGLNPKVHRQRCTTRITAGATGPPANAERERIITRTCAGRWVSPSRSKVAGGKLFIIQPMSNRRRSSTLRATSSSGAADLCRLFRRSCRLHLQSRLKPFVPDCNTCIGQGTASRWPGTTTQSVPIHRPLQKSMYHQHCMPWALNGRYHTIAMLVDSVNQVPICQHLSGHSRSA